MTERKPEDLLSSELEDLWTYVGSAVHDAIMCTDGGHHDTAGEHIGALTDAERARAEAALERVLGYVRRAERLPDTVRRQEMGLDLGEPDEGEVPDPRDLPRGVREGAP